MSARVRASACSACSTPSCAKAKGLHHSWFQRETVSWADGGGPPWCGGGRMWGKLNPRLKVASKVGEARRKTAGCTDGTGGAETATAREHGTARQAIGALTGGAGRSEEGETVAGQSCFGALTRGREWEWRQGVHTTGGLQIHSPCVALLGAVKRQSYAFTHRRQWCSPYVSQSALLPNFLAG